MARVLRSQPATRDVVLVALSGYARKRDRAGEAGFRHLLAKPPNIPELEQLRVMAARKV